MFGAPAIVVETMSYIILSNNDRCTKHHPLLIVYRAAHTVKLSVKHLFRQEMLALAVPQTVN